MAIKRSFSSSRKIASVVVVPKRQKKEEEDKCKKKKLVLTTCQVFAWIIESDKYRCDSITPIKTKQCSTAATDNEEAAFRLIEEADAYYCGLIRPIKTRASAKTKEEEVVKASAPTSLMDPMDRKALLRNRFAETIERAQEKLLGVR
ncbi:hypothetical protein H6P81_007593 [Aristolochia fimbriata]|uniref:Uncharacterized protein n=1 Tax=Aristolochia fimbriata TaxID=158543 RepID=A0AAV7F200_ARIFI|nr:hypothetical protein H6P81_007593 [Aristolochia fimbriata]